MPIFSNRPPLSAVSGLAGPWVTPHEGLTTYNTAFGAVSAKADVWVELGKQPQTALPSSLRTDTSTGRYFIERPDGVDLLLRFHGTDAENETGGWRLWGWDQITTPNSVGVQHHPCLLGAGTFTLSAKTGVAAGILSASVFYADTITVTSNRSLAPGLAVVWPGAADDGSVYLVVPMGFHARFEVELSRQGQTAASLGFMYAGISAR